MTSGEKNGLRVTTPSRLHFGLLAFGEGAQRQYGGVGVMVRRPGIELLFSPAARFSVAGELVERVQQAAQRWVHFYGRANLPACHIHVLRAPRQHIGLGVGTQISLAVAAGLHAWSGEPCPPPAQLAMSVQRALRSAVGVYGFCEGGLIVERGKLPHEPLSPLDCRIDLPEPWRFVLVCPRHTQGLSGPDEASAFAQLPPVAADVTRQLVDEVQLRLLPAAAQGDFGTFSESLYRYGFTAGLCFASLQGGAYHGAEVARIVEWLRQSGIQGVGQTSWGPTVFVVLPDESAAQAVCRLLREKLGDSAHELIISAPDNTGAQIAWI
jgi:beta-RFAP synthase